MKKSRILELSFPSLKYTFPGSIVCNHFSFSISLFFSFSFFISTSLKLSLSLPQQYRKVVLVPFLFSTEQLLPPFILFLLLSFYNFLPVFLFILAFFFGIVVSYYQSCYTTFILPLPLFPLSLSLSFQNFYFFFCFCFIFFKFHCSLVFFFFFHI